MPRDIITLACNECKRRNYTSKKNKKNNPDRVEHTEVLPVVPEAHCTPRDPVAYTGVASGTDGVPRASGRRDTQGRSSVW